MNFLALMKAAVTATAALLASVALAGPPTYPFGARIDPYLHGTKPNHLTNAQMDSTIQSRYNDWKAKRLARTVPTIPGGMAVKFTDYVAPAQNPPPIDDQPKLTTSESMGYGMLLAVIMAGYDAEAQQIFDGLLTTVRARPADGTGQNALMEWELRQDSSSKGAPGDRWAALDGDLDIAMALLMADRQWGSTGTHNYKQQALDTIAAIRAWFTYPDGRLLVRPVANTSRTSDYMFGHFRAFAQATGDADGFWASVIQKQLTLLEQVIANYSPVAGLQPDCVANTDTSPTPPPQRVCDLGSSAFYERYYASNAQRNPWRFGTDYVLSGEPRLRVILERMMDFFMADNGGTPGPADPSWDVQGNMAIGYKLDGTRMTPADYGATGTWPAIGHVAGAMNGAQVHTRFQGYLNDSWDWLNAKWTGQYYDAELTLLSMIVASGNWWNPAPSGVQPPPPPPPPPGSKIQAENGVLQGAGVSVKTDVAGYESGGFVGNFSNNGDSLTVTFGAVAAGTYDIRIRYHAWGPQENAVSINGVARTVQFPVTHPNWAYATIAGVQLAAGSNTVTITKQWGWINVDFIEIVAPGGGGGTPPPVPVMQQVQAEAGSVSGSGVSVKTDLAGYEGSGFVGNFTNNGDQLLVPFSNVVASTYTVRIRYHAWGPQQNNVLINGASRTESFPGTGSGWAEKTISGVALQAGTNTIGVSKDWGYFDIDWIQIVP